LDHSRYFPRVNSTMRQPSLKHKLLCAFPKEHLATAIARSATFQVKTHPNWDSILMLASERGIHVSRQQRHLDVAHSPVCMCYGTPHTRSAMRIVVPKWWSPRGGLNLTGSKDNPDRRACESNSASLQERSRGEVRVK